MNKYRQSFIGDTLSDPYMVEDMRVDYRDGGRIEIPDKNKPLQVLLNWIEEARRNELIEANAMCISTIGKNGYPKSRMVLIKHINDFEIGFFTNLDSDKANEINEDGRVSGVIFWPKLERQVRITGRAVLINRDAVLKYHLSRPRSSQIAAYTSSQSRPLESLEHLLKEFEETENRFQNKDIPLPKHWGGYVINIESIEYWSGRPSRLHERVKLELIDKRWFERRLYP